VAPEVQKLPTQRQNVQSGKKSQNFGGTGPRITKVKFRVPSSFANAGISKNGRIVVAIP
jgi:hypothetical protein